MKLADVVKCVSDSTGLSCREVSGVIRKYQNIIHDCLIDGDRVSIHRVGSLEIAEQAARRCRNIHTGEPLEVPKKKRIRFRCSPDLKGTLNT